MNSNFTMALLLVYAKHWRGRKDSRGFGIIRFDEIAKWRTMIEQMDDSQAAVRSIWKTALLKKHVSLVLVILFSVLYFTETSIRAYEKAFWFDELVTLHVCRYPTFGAAWAAVLQGHDFNPPLFYLIQRADRAMFGEGNIAMRLPQMIGFWIFCVSLFRFAGRRAGPLAGWVAMLIPELTLAYFYAYDARAHGITLGFCGLALVCWQMTEERPRSLGWLAGLALSLEAALLTHCYGILIFLPFAAVEVFRALRLKSIDVRRCLALIVPPIVASFVYVPLLRSYRSNLGPVFTAMFLPNFTAFIYSYAGLLGVSTVVVLVALTVFGLKRAGFRSQFESRRDNAIALTNSEVIVIVAFLFMPGFGVLFAKFINAPFILRYFVSAVVGIAIPIALGVAARPRSRGSLAIALLVTLLVVKSTAAVTWHRYRGVDEILFEPSTGAKLNMTPGDPMAIHPLLKSDPLPSLPILIPHVLDYYYLLHYCPAQASRFCTLKPLHTKESVEEFLPSHRHFLLYALEFEECYRLLSDLTAKGGNIKSLKLDGLGHFLAEVQMPASDFPAKPSQ